METPQDQSSPVKHGKNTSVSRQQRSYDVEQAGIHSAPAFVEEHLNVPANWEKFTVGTSAEIARIATDLPQPQCYENICDLLNKISILVHASLGLDEDDRLDFIDHHTASLTHHPFDKDILDKPDFLAIRRRLLLEIEYPHASGTYSRVPWHHADSVCEWKGKKELNGTSQCAVYAGALNQARPDKPGSYALYASTQDYRVMWSDPSGCLYSRHHRWQDLKPLVGYVYSLYIPPAGHIAFDPSIKRSPLIPDEDPLGPPLWDVTFENITYRRCETLFVGDYWGRMTWVARSKMGITIKDSYRSDSRRWDEGKLFKDVHEHGHVGGWVQVAASGDVMIKDKPIRTGRPNHGRTKRRLVMTTTGDNIYACSSIEHFLKVMYDVFEAHRWVTANRRVIHRDMSINNILVNPSGGKPCSYPGSSRPKFIREVLDKIDNADSLALICDLDNGRHRDRGPDPTPGPTADDVIVKDRSGTPVFISRSVAVGQVLQNPSRYVSIPKLPVDLKPAYIAAHSDDAFRAYEDVPGKHHGGHYMDDLFMETLTSSTSAAELYDHYPRHDAESLYWVIVAFLLRALPDGDAGNTDDHEKCLIREYKSLNDHDLGAKNDSRLGFLSWRPEDWKDALHTSFGCVAPLLLELSMQVSPEYAFLSPPPPEMHLHEAMQRILLKYIGLLSKLDTRINQNKLRTVTETRETKDVIIDRPAIGSKGRSRSIFTSSASTRTGTRSSSKRSMTPAEAASTDADVAHQNKRPRTRAATATQNKGKGK